MAAVRMSAENRRNQIIRVAAELFARQGFKGTTTREIAEKAGITDALVFRYFDTKESLYSAIITLKTCESANWDHQKIEKAIASKDDTRVFQGFALALLELATRDPGLMRLLLHSALEDHQLSNLFFQSQMTDLVKVLGGYIQTRIDDGTFHLVDSMIAARGFIGMINHQLLMREIFKHEAYVKYTNDGLAETFTDLFLNGVRK